MLSIWLRLGEEAGYSTAAAPSSVSLSPSRWDIFLELRSRMRAHWPAGTLNISSQRDESLPGSILRFPVRFSVRKRMRPDPPCPKQAWTLTLHNKPRPALARLAPALRFLAEQDNGAFVRREHADPVPDGLVTGKVNSSTQMSIRRAMFGLFGALLKPVHVDAVGHGPSAGMAHLALARTHAAMAAALGSSGMWDIRAMVRSTVAEVAGLT